VGEEGFKYGLIPSLLLKMIDDQSYLGCYLRGVKEIKQKDGYPRGAYGGDYSKGASES